MLKKITLKIIKLKGIGRLKYYIMEGDEQVSAFIELMSIYVKPEFRRQGYGSTLIRKLIKIANEKNVKCIYVKVTKENEVFWGFLEKYGFTPSPKQILFQKSMTYHKIATYLRELGQARANKNSKSSEKYSGETETRFFRLISWLAFPFLELLGERNFLNFLEKIDKFLLKIPLLRKYLSKIAFFSI